MGSFGLAVKTPQGCILSSGFGDGGGLAVGPGGVFVVDGAVFEAAVEDAYQPVSEGA
jgi:hypothetical protein